MTYFVRFLCSVVLLAFFLAVTAAHAQAPAFDRAISCTASPQGYGYGPRQVAVDGQGNTLAAGVFSGTVALGNALLTAAGTGGGPTTVAPADVFVTKLDAAGTYVWAAQIMGTLPEDVAGIAVDAAGDVYVTGAFESFSVALGPSITLFNSSARSEAYVAKLSGATGQWLWARRQQALRLPDPDFNRKRLQFQGGAFVFSARCARAWGHPLPVRSVARLWRAYSGPGI